jgi:beta-mannosidase
MDNDTAELEILVEIRRNFGPPDSVVCRLDIADQKLILSIPYDDHGGKKAIRLRTQNLKPWWPHDHGDQELYSWEAKLVCGDAIIDEKSGNFGIRISEFIQEPSDDGTCSFKVRINGRDVFLKGMNWTPADAIFTRVNRERYRELLAAAKEANINALRVWGGGIYELEDFYSLCDEFGFVVLQDFMYACGCYPQATDFLEEARKEADHVVRSLRHHPCICGWFGDNENADTAATRLFSPEYRHNRLSQEVLRQAVSEGAPGAPYAPTSPFSPALSDANSDLQGDCHLWAHGKSYRDPFYTEKRPRMITEIGHLGMPSREVVLSFVSQEKLWPVWHEEYLMHGADCNRRDRTARWQTLWDSINVRGWPAPENLDELIEQTQRLQTEATEFWITTYGNQPQCWGIFLWNLADSWPQMSDAYIAYPFSPKPALAAVRDGYAKLDR